MGVKVVWGADASLELRGSYLVRRDGVLDAIKSFGVCMGR
jgi:hypothetical protein